MTKQELLKKIEEANTTEELEALKAEMRSLEDEAESKDVESKPVENTAESAEQSTEEPKAEESTTDEPKAEEPKKEEPEMSESEERSLLAGNEVQTNFIKNGGMKKMEKEVKSLNAELEQRGADLKAGKKITINAEQRSQTVSSGTVLLNKKYKNTLDETFDAVSGMVDEMNSIQLNGGESYSVAFEKSYDEAGYTTEGGEYTDIDVDTDYVETGRAKITAYAEITKEYKKLPNIDYVSLVTKRVRDSIRRKLGAQAIVGTGAANTIKGIYNADTKVLTGAADVELSAIDQDTLNEIIFAFGGNEAVEGTQKLILSKKDLEAFSKVKYTDGRFVYNITKNGKTGTIAYKEGGASVEYVINSACNALSDSSVVAGKYTMIYGSLASYELPVFSDLEIEESTDYQFKKGIIAYRGDVIVGGTVSKYEGFVRIKKIAAV